MIDCPVCGHAVHEDAVGCPNCGASPRLSATEAEDYRRVRAEEEPHLSFPPPPVLPGWSRRVRALALVPALLAPAGAVAYSIRVYDPPANAVDYRSTFVLDLAVVCVLALVPALLAVLPRRLPLAVAVAASVLGLLFAASSVDVLQGDVRAAWSGPVVLLVAGFCYVPAFAVVRSILQRRADRASDAGPSGRARVKRRSLVVHIALSLGVAAAIVVATVFVSAVLLLGVMFSTWGVHTQTVKTSPDGDWSLFIDTHDEGALGGSTRITLRPSGGGAPRLVLHESGWLADREVRWLDRRTVEIGARLMTPFVEHGIETGSPGTSGGELDLGGYVRNDIAPGERVAMLSGLSFVLPGDLAGQLETRRSPSDDGLPTAWQELLPGIDGDLWPDDWRYTVSSLREARDSTLVRHANSGRLLGRSRHVIVRWQPEAEMLFVITHLPGRMIGLVAEQDVALRDADAARARAESMWRTLHVDGADLPWCDK